MAASNISVVKRLQAIYVKGAVISALFCACMNSVEAEQPDCPATTATLESAQVRHVHDGDTLWLRDGRKIRLIGIDTPELGRDQRPDQPFAPEARDALRKLLQDNGSRVRLGYGPQQRDRYQRTLAHLYLNDGRSVQAYLLTQGLATALTVPPNDTRSACYRQREADALAGRRGIWSLPAYQLLSVDQLGAHHAGFTRITGRVSEVHFSDKGAYLKLNRLTVKINHNDLQYFDAQTLRQLPGRNIELRGWLHPRKHHWFMSLRHPDALIID